MATWSRRGLLAAPSAPQLRWPGAAGRPPRPTHYLAGAVDWRLLALLLPDSFGGAILGSKSATIIPERGLKLAIVALIVAGAVSTIAKAWHQRKLMGGGLIIYLLSPSLPAIVPAGMRSQRA